MQELFSCMLDKFMDEYKFLQYYPDKDVIKTAELFGGVIDLGLIT